MKKMNRANVFTVLGTVLLIIGTVWLVKPNFPTNSDILRFLDSVAGYVFLGLGFAYIAASAANQPSTADDQASQDEKKE